MCLSLFSSRGQRRNMTAAKEGMSTTRWFSVLKCMAAFQMIKAELRELGWGIEKAYFFEISIGWDFYLTVHPADTYRLKYGYKQQTHPAGSVRVKQLEDVHPSLMGWDRCQFSVKTSLWALHRSHQIWNTSLWAWFGQQGLTVFVPNVSQLIGFRRSQ